LGLLKDGKLSEEGADNLAKAKYAEDKEKIGKAKEVFEKCKLEVTPEKAGTEKCANGRLLRKCFIEHGADIQLFNKA